MLHGQFLGWHNVSTHSNATVNGVTVEDILSILKSIFEVTDPWQIKVLDLYNHVVNQYNPHQLTIDQIPTKIIEVLYNRWRSVGYDGEINEFIEILFNYLEYATLEEALEGTLEDKILTVALLKAVVDQHDTDPDAHTEIFSNLFVGDPTNIPTPIFSINQVVGAPEKDQIIHDAVHRLYKYSMFKESSPNTYTVLIRDIPDREKIYQCIDRYGTGWIVNISPTSVEVEYRLGLDLVRPTLARMVNNLLRSSKVIHTWDIPFVRDTTTRMVLRMDKDQFSIIFDDGARGVIDIDLIYTLLEIEGESYSLQKYDLSPNTPTLVIPEPVSRSNFIWYNKALTDQQIQHLLHSVEG